MINNTESKKVYEVQSGVTEYPIGFPFHFNADQTPQLSVVIGHDVLQLNYNCKLSEDKGTLILIPTEEEAEKLTGPDDYSWMDKWVGAHLVIERDIPFVQESDYQLGRISAEQIEHDFDASVMRDQMLADKIGEHTVDVQAEVDAINTRIDGIQQEYVEDMEDIDYALATKATKTELENAKATLHAGIQGNAQAIQKTRADMNEKDSELETILNDHANRLNTLRTDHDDLGDDVSDIQAKIPESASGSNPLVTKQQLLDEEMDIREDLNSDLSEVQTQITAQAAAIAKKAEKDSVYTKEQVDAKVSSVYKVKGSVANYDSLPTNASIGDVYDTLDSGANYVWTENGWDKLSDIVDLTDYAKKTDLDGYLPLSGGEVTGPLVLDTGTATFGTAIIFRVLRGETVVERAVRYTNTGQIEINNLQLTGVYSIMPRDGSALLGGSSSRWGGVFTNKLNSLSVPTEGGTLARIEDVNAIGGEGTTGQVLTKTDDGFAWQDSAGGDYLPLAGGTMTGTINYDTDYGSTKGSTIILSAAATTSGILGQDTKYGSLQFTSNGYFVINDSLNPIDIDYAQHLVYRRQTVEPAKDLTAWLGSRSRRFLRVSTKSISNGGPSSWEYYDIVVPEKSGTMATIEDIEERIGNISTALTAILGE